MFMHRRSYRKNLKIEGTLVVGTKEIKFFTKDVSLDGFHAYSSKAISLENGDIVYVRLPMLSMEGVASTVWQELGPDDIYHIGFKFINMRGVGGSAYRYREAERHQLTAKF